MFLDSKPLDCSDCLAELDNIGGCDALLDGDSDVWAHLISLSCQYCALPCSTNSKGNWIVTSRVIFFEMPSRTNLLLGLLSSFWTNHV